MVDVDQRGDGVVVFIPATLIDGTMAGLAINFVIE